MTASPLVTSWGNAGTSGCVKAGNSVADEEAERLADVSRIGLTDKLAAIQRAPRAAARKD